MPDLRQPPDRWAHAYPLLFAALCAALALFLLAVKTAVPKPLSTPIRLVEEPSFQPAAAPPPSADLPGETRLSLVFAGDIMQHREQMHDDFAAAYVGIRPLLAAADLAVGNLEFPVHPGIPVGPPPLSVRFNGSPMHLKALAESGLDVLVTANNHAFDQGLDGALSTLEQVGEAGMLGVGTGDTLDRAGPLVLDVKGIRTAIAAYTFRPNSYGEAEGKIAYWDRSWPIHELNFPDWTAEYRDKGLRVFAAHAEGARRRGAQVLIAFVHWGEEWHFHPTEHQRLAARDLIDAGFDLVVGSHPHVLNPAELYQGRLIAYSLGNLLSAFEPLEVRTAALLEVDLGIPPTGSPRLLGFRYRPILTEHTTGTSAAYRVVALAESDREEHARALRLARRILGDAAVVPASPDASTNSDRPR